MWLTLPDWHGSRLRSIAPRPLLPPHETARHDEACAQAAPHAGQQARVTARACPNMEAARTNERAPLCANQNQPRTVPYRTARQVKFEQDVEIRRQEEAAARGYQFRASPVPQASLEPRYEEMLLRQVGQGRGG